MTMRVLAALLALGLAACGGTDDPFTRDLKIVCGAGADRDDLPPDMRRAMAMREVADKIRDPEVARLIATAMQLAPADRVGLIAPALKRAGLQRCPLLLE